jgi:hypothetical protein
MKSEFNMFNLDQAIAEWRKELHAAGMDTAALLDELESHLREEIERQRRAGHGAQQSFEIARLCIGHADSLGAEFEKAGSAMGTPDRWLARFVLYAAGLGYGWVLFWAAHAVLHTPMGRAERLTGLAAIALSVAAAFGGRWVRQFLPAIPDKRVRAAIQAAGFLPAIVLLPVFSQVVLPHWDLTDFRPGPLLVAALWTTTSLPFAFGLWKGLEESVCRSVNVRKQNV